MYNTTSRAPIDELSKNSDVEEKTDTVEDVAEIDTEPIASNDLGRIAIIGKGPYGVAMFDALLRTDHDVVMGVRTPAGNESVGSVELFHPDYTIHHRLQKDVARQRIRTVPDAISQADVVVVCIPCTSHTRFVKENAAILRRRGAEKLNSGGTGIVMIDTSNTRHHDQDSSVAEQLQAALMAECLTSRISHSYVCVVKAFNTVSELPQQDMLRSEDAVPVCGNDITAKNTAMNLGSEIGLRPFDIGNLDNARQMEANGYSNWSKWGRAAIATFFVLTFFLVYCTLWYMVVDSPILNAPVYTWDQPALVINKACSNTALTLLAVTYLPGKLAHIHQIIRKDCNRMLPFFLSSWLQIRNQLGITAGWFMVVHTALTMTLTTPNISEQQSSSQLKNLLAQITLLIGVVAACLWLPVTLSPVPAIRQGLSVRKWKFLHNTVAHTALFVAGAHGMMFWLSMYVCPVDGECLYLVPLLSSYPASMPPPSSISSIIAIYVVVLHLILTIGRVKRVHGDRSGKVKKGIITKSMAMMRGKTDSKWHKEMAQGLVALAFTYSGEDGGLNNREFITAFSDLPTVYVDRLFHALDIDESGWVGMETMLPIFMNDHPVLVLQFLCSFYEQTGPKESKTIRNLLHKLPRSAGTSLKVWLQMLETKELTDLLEEALSPMNRSLKKKHIKRRERVMSANEIALRAMCVQFIKFSSRDACLHIDEFYSAFKELDRDHARVLFDKVFDMNKDGVISFSEFKTAANVLLSLDCIARLELMFDMVDSDKSGTIEYAELLALLHNGLASSKVVLSDSDARSLVDNFISSAISRKSSTLDYEQVHIPRADFVHWMQRTDTDKLLDLSATVLSWMKSDSKNSYSTKSHTYWLRNHQREVGGAFVWLAATVIISVYAFHTYYNQVPYISFGLAKLGAWNIMMNTCFLYLLMMRNVLSWARQTWIFHIFNTDNHVTDHVFIGKMIGIYSILHIVAHIIDYIKIPGLWDNKWKTFGLIPGAAFITGVVLTVLFVLMYLPALARTGDVPKFMKPMIAKMDLFRTFYVTHRLYYFWFSILLIHSPNFWKFWAVPGTIWFLSKFHHFVQFRLLSGATEFGARLEALPDNVTKVTIPYKAAHSKLTAGSYVRIMLPDIAVHEFHPFSVASSGTRDELVLYCKAVGPWTKKLLSLAQERQYTGVLPSDFAVYLPMPPSAATGKSGGGKPNYNQSVSVGNQDSCRDLGGASTSDVNMFPSLRKCVVVGPFGAPAASMFHAKRAVVMAGGIGVTPFAALLDTLLDISDHPEKKPRNFALERVHFVWTVRNMESLSWIEDLINQVELRRAKDTELRQMLQLHIYVTSKKSAENIGAQFLQLLRMGADGYDAISGLRHAVEFGRPDIDGLLGEIASESKHMPTVFFCGPPFLGKTIGKVAAKYKMRFAEEHF